MKLSRQALLRVACILGAALGCNFSNAYALECPKSQPLDETSGANPDLSKQLLSENALSQIPGILGALHQQYPGVSKPKLADYIISAYCPIVAGAAGLSEQEKQAKTKEFADRVVATEY
jgi:hypothetical protein